MTAMILLGIGFFAVIGIVVALYWFTVMLGRMMRDMDNHD